MRGEALGQGFAALQYAQHVEYDPAEGGPLGQLRGNRKRPVERDTGHEVTAAGGREDTSMACS